MMSRRLIALLCVCYSGFVYSKLNNDPHFNPAIIAHVASRAHEQAAEQEKKDVSAANAGDSDSDCDAENIRQLVKTYCKKFASQSVSCIKTGCESAKKDSWAAMNNDICSLCLWSSAQATVALRDAERKGDADAVREAKCYQSLIVEISRLIPGALGANDIMMLNRLATSLSREGENISAEELATVLEDHLVNISLELRGQFAKRPELLAVESVAIKLASIGIVKRVYDLWSSRSIKKAELIVALDEQRKMIIALAIPVCEVVHIAKNSKTDTQAAPAQASV